MKESKEFSDSDGEELVKMARKSVTEFLRNNSKIDDAAFDSKFDCPGKVG